jgi:Putative adhesin
MSQWTVDAPMRLAFDDVTALKVRAIAGSVAILATSETPALDITRISGQPLTVTHEDGVLTISYEDLTWDGLLEWLRPRNHSAEMTVTVPRDCPAQVGVVAATAVVSGVAARTSVKSVSGAITLDGLNGTVDARTVGGDVEAQDINGQVTFNSVSGDLTVAGGSLDRLDARTVTGRVTADVHLGKPGHVRIATVSSDVALRLPAQPDARVSLRSTSGRVLSEFDCLRSSHAPASHSVNGTLGAGTGHISVTTLSGRVTLLRRAEQAAPAPDGPADSRPSPDDRSTGDRSTGEAGTPAPGTASPDGAGEAGQSTTDAGRSRSRVRDPWASATDPAPMGSAGAQDDAQTKGETR